MKNLITWQTSKKYFSNYNINRLSITLVNTEYINKENGKGEDKLYL